ncbi:hypothetical protein B0920_02050 [Massilia sp. KIM]|nr:hypothetical protein B0920_02050 [Massilia sp. KIM]
MKLETAYGVDNTPDGATNWIEARNVNLTPMEMTRKERDIILPYMGNAGSVVTGIWAKLSFDVALVGSGTAGTAPKFSAPLLGCGMAQTVVATTSVAYNLVSQNHSSVVGYMYIDGVLHKLTGMRGNCKGTMAQQDTPRLTFEFDALYVTPVVGPLPAVTRTGWQTEEGVNAKNTQAASVNGVDLSWSAFDFDLGNKISRLNLPGPHLAIEITDRMPNSSLTVLAPPLAAFNPFALAESNQVVPVSVAHGSTAGKKARYDLQARVADVSYTEVEGIAAYSLKLEPTPVAGNDEVALTLL